jgi:hypothetical protein
VAQVLILFPNVSIHLRFIYLRLMSWNGFMAPFRQLVAGSRANVLSHALWLKECEQ